MASPAFGFSVGDFIAAVELITKIATALKDVGGAAHDSQVLIGELELLKTLLARIVPSSEDTLTQKCDPAVKAQADRTLKTLDEFAKSISKFDPKLEAACSNRDATQLQIIQVALQLEERTSRDSWNKEFETLTAGLKSAQLQNQEIPRIGGDLSGGFQKMETTIASRAKSHEQLLSAMAKKHEQSLLSIQACIAAIMADRSEFNMTFKNQSSGFPNRLDLQASLPSLDANRQAEATLLPASADKETRIVSGDLDRFYTDLFVLVWNTVRNLRDLLILFWSLYPTIGKCLKALRSSILRAPLLALSDRILFEDALGRTFRIEYQYFKDWGTFEAFLRCQFRGLPMERKIQQGDYRLLLATSQRTSIQKSDWENVVQPGSSVVMSLEMQALSLAIRVGYKKGKCPRKDCAGVLAQMPQQAIFLCRNCGLETSVNPQGSAAEDFINNGKWNIEIDSFYKKRQDITSLKARISSSDGISTDPDHSKFDSLFGFDKNEEKYPFAEAQRFEERAIVHCRRIHINDVYSYASRVRERSGSSLSTHGIVMEHQKPEELLLRCEQGVHSLFKYGFYDGYRQPGAAPYDRAVYKLLIAKFKKINIMQRLVEPLLKYYAGTVAKEMVQPVIEAMQLAKITPSAANIHIRDEIIDLALKFQRFSRSCDHMFYRFGDGWDREIYFFGVLEFVNALSSLSSLDVSLVQEVSQLLIGSE